MEARFARVPLRLENSGISHFRIAPDFRQPFGHGYHQQEEVYLLVAGRVRAKLGDEVVELEMWDAVRVPLETPRAFETGPEGGRDDRLRRTQHREPRRRAATELVDELRPGPPGTLSG